MSDPDIALVIAEQGLFSFDAVTVMVRGEGRLSDMFNRIKLEEFPMSPRGTGKFVDCVDDSSVT